MWGSAFALTTAVVESLDPRQVVLGRLAVGALVLLPAWAVAGQARWPRGTRLWAFFLLIALISKVIPFSLISWGQQFIDSGLAGLLTAIVLLFTLVLAHFTVPGERRSAVLVCAVRLRRIAGTT